MDLKSCRRLNTVSLIILLLGHVEIVQSATNLEINGNQVSGESFLLQCSTRTTNILNYAAFYRSVNSGQEGTAVGYRAFYLALTPSCIEGKGLEENYTVSCNSDGSMFTLAISANNTIEHKSYWRCQTNTDNNMMDNNVINMCIIVNISGISWVSPVVGPDNMVNIISDKPTQCQCQTTPGRPAANITWYLDNVPLSGGTTTTTPVSGELAITTGYMTLTVNRTADDKVLSCKAINYVNMEPVESTVKPVIRVKSPPDPPIQLRTALTDSSITLFWLSGFHGGADQTFTVEYRTTTETVFKVAAVISGGQEEGVQFNTTIQELSPDTQYVIQITCSNIFGQQREISFIKSRTAPDTSFVSTSKSTSIIGPAVGGSIGGLFGVVLVGLIVYLLKPRCIDKSSDTTIRNTAADGNRVYDTLQITSPEASPYQTLELNDPSSSGVYVNLEL